MSSQGNRHGHLDATSGRDVVFCHACSNEWYQDEHGLECPECRSDITEIVDPDNDPRASDNHNSSASTSPEMPPLRLHDDDSDPEEGDIEEHMGPHGFAFRRSVRDGHHHHHHHHNPGVDPVLERFVDMIRGFSPPGRAGGGGGAAAGNMFPSRSGEFEHHPHDHHQHNHHQHYGQPRIHRATFTSGTFGGGSAQVTIVSGPIHHNFGDSPGGDGPDPFQAIFSNVLRDLGPPDDGNRQGGEEHGGGPPPGFARSLHDILSLLNPANAMAGDAVYSQEALDRIITSLMETNPQSNAAPPATQEALQNLPRKPVDKEMLTSNGGDGSAECTICIEEMAEGQMAAILPCKHWFHEECVVLWLKEHNTCPICRTPIEKSDRNNTGANNNNNNNDNGDGNGNGNGSGSNPPGGGAPGPGAPTWQRGPGLRMPGSFSFTTPWNSGPPPGFGGPMDGPETPSTQYPRVPRPPSQSQSPLNEVLRNLSSTPRERERNRERDRAAVSGYSSYDTSRLQRRTSHSPTSPRNMTAEEQGARWRQRSPSESSRRSMVDRDRDQDQDRDQDRDQRRSSGPFGWLRDRFGGASGGGPNRDGRRQ